MQYDYDLLIVGGGLAGNCLALALKDSGLKIALIEENTRKQLDESPAGDRALALAAGTVTLLDALGAWQDVHRFATAIKAIHVSDRGHFGKTRLSAEKEKVDALGYVITARDLEMHVARLLDQTSVEQLCPGRLTGLIAGKEIVNVSLNHNNQSMSFSAKLVVGADGGNSSVRKLLEMPQETIDYGQTALVTTVSTSVPHDNVAYERFTPFGPLAMLPMTANQCAVVWTRTHEDANTLLHCSDTEFLTELQRCFGYSLGELELKSPHRAFPLSLVRAGKMIAHRTVMIGNAVHQLHPVAGQGFNLGLRDLALLAEMILSHQEADMDIGAVDCLTTYARRRQKDHDQTIGFTHSLVRVFSNDWLPLLLVRNMGLIALDQLPFAKTFLTRHAMGLAEPLPRIGSRR